MEEKYNYGQYKKDFFTHETETRLANSFLSPDKLGSKTPTIVVYGPQGCGKTKSALAIAAAFNLRRIIDGWDGKESLPATNALVLTSLDLEHTNIFFKKMHYNEVMKVVRPHR